METEKINVHKLEQVEKKLQQLMVPKMTQVEEEESKKFNLKSNLYSVKQVALQVYELYGSYANTFALFEKLNLEVKDKAKKVRAEFHDLYVQFEKDVVNKEDECNHLENEIDELKSVKDAIRREYEDLHLLENDFVAAESSLRSLKNEYLQLEHEIKSANYELSYLSKTEEFLLEQQRSAEDTVLKLHDEQNFVEKKENLVAIRNNLEDVYVLFGETKRFEISTVLLQVKPNWSQFRWVKQHFLRWILRMQRYLSHFMSE